MTGAMSAPLATTRYRNSARDDDREDRRLQPQPLALGRRSPRDRLVGARRLAQRAQHLRRGRDRLVGPGEGDQRVVHEREVPASLAAADVHEDVGRRLVRVIAPEDLLEVGLDPAMAGGLGRRREQVRIRATRGRPVDHRAQHPRRIIGGRAGLGPDEVADVPARDEGARDQTQDRHRAREREADGAQGERCRHREPEIAAGRDLEPRPSEEGSRLVDPRRVRLAHPGTQTRRGLRARWEHGHQQREHRDPGRQGADQLHRSPSSSSRVRRRADGVHS